jgi:hypothetical protein
VTHAISFLPKTDMIITMVDGKIGEMGTFKDLMNHNGAFADFLNNYMSEKVKDNYCEDDGINHYYVLINIVLNVFMNIYH